MIKTSDRTTRILSVPSSKEMVASSSQEVRECILQIIKICQYLEMRQNCPLCRYLIHAPHSMVVVNFLDFPVAVFSA